MKLLKDFAPPDLVEALKKNAEYTNLPSIGVPDNFAFPGVQANPAAAVSFEECRSIQFQLSIVPDVLKQFTEIGLQGMGDFGSVKGHEDEGDSVGAVTTLVANSRIPAGYEAGRFHLLWLGCYIKLNQFITLRV